MRVLVSTVLFSLLFIPAAAQNTEPAASPFTYQEVMVPMRDGVHLQTVILAPSDQKGPLPILFRRTPYGVPDKAPEKMPANLKELAQDGYIFVIQNLRGRFKSEGVFNLSSWVDLKDPKATNETTDAYDSIEWLVKNVSNNNGKVGLYGVSYSGLTAALPLLHPHPALKAVSEQASPADQWMNDDDHRYGALRESYDFEYAVMEQADKNKNTHFDFNTYDTYQWYLDLGPLSNINDKYLHGSIPYWNSSVDHLTTTNSGRRKRGSISFMPPPFQTSTSPDFGIRKIRGDRGRFSAMRRKATQTIRILWSPDRGFTASGNRIKAITSA